MKVRFLQSIAGEDFSAWPGLVTDIPTKQARKYFTAGIAEPAGLEAETAAIAADTRTAVLRPPRARRVK